MPTKTARILGYLPATFRAAPLLSALRAVIDAPGRELLHAENALAALMRAHWVDHADRGARPLGGEHTSEAIDDLARIAALYGLAPRPDEGVEEFRRHLKRTVRTFLEGTVTVQGILRVTAETLGLEIDDDEIDFWWDRASGSPGGGQTGHELITREPRADDATELVLGARSASARGRPAAPAIVTGTVDLSGGVELGAASALRVKLGAAATVEVDLAAAATLDQVTDAIDDALGRAVATHDGRFLTLASPSAGAASRLELPAGPLDTAVSLLGLLPRTFSGLASEPAAVAGTADLAAGADLSDERYLRLLLDGTTVAEADCAGVDPAQTSLDEIVAAINAAFGMPIAGHDGRFLTLNSPTAGAGSSLVIQRPAAQDAARRLLGSLPATAFFGRAARPARLEGPPLGSTVDLSARSEIRLRIDQAAGIVVDCAGEDPASTRPEEIVAAINAAFAGEVAALSGGAVTVASPKLGPTSRISLLKLPEGDASGLIFGISPRIFQGSDAEPASLVGASFEDADLRARKAFQIAVDGAGPVVVDLRRGAEDPEHVTLAEIVDAIRRDLGSGVASHDGTRLILTSPAADGSGSLTVGPLEKERRRRFVSRAILAEEAAPPLLGFAARAAHGSAATAARVIGAPDLSRGVDLRIDRFLRLRVDGGAAVEIDCAGERPRATTLDELETRISAAAGKDVATGDGRGLILTSPSTGTGSRIAFEPPRAADALSVLLGVEPGTFRGTGAIRVAFAGTVDLSDGVALGAGAAVKLGVDGADAVEIELTDTAATLSLGQLTTVINFGLGVVIAGQDGTRLLLTSPTVGAASALELAVPGGPDATAAIFGVAAPRAYHGRDARPATVTGHAIAGPLDLRTARHLSLAIDGEAAQVDVAAETAFAEAVTLDEAAAVIDGAFPGTTSVDGDRLVLTAPTAGFSSRIVLDRVSGGDARALLFGDVPDEVTGAAPSPAILTGEVDLLSPVNLEQRRRLRLRVDGGTPVDVDVAGAVPAQTLLAEVVAAIDGVLPGLAAATDDDHLELTSPTAGEASRLEVMPRRYLEVVEYPPEPRELKRPAVHANGWSMRNAGAADAVLGVEIRAPHGVFGVGLVHRGLGLMARLLEPIGAGSSLRLWRDRDGGLASEIVNPEGEAVAVDPSCLRVESLSSSLGKGGAFDHSAVLTLPRGRSRWLYLECEASRFDEARFGTARFAGEPCREVGVFDVSRFAEDPPEAGDVTAVFGPPEHRARPVEIALRWQSHRPGAFEVNLPAELPSRFGGRFGAGRFGANGSELYAGVALEPPINGEHLISRVGAASNLVAEPEIVPLVPLGFVPATAPVREPCFLTLGGFDTLSGTDRPATLFIAAEGLDGFLAISAKKAGEWGNEIAVSVRPAGPGRYDVHVHFAGARFENARQAARGAPLPSAAAELLAPGPVGVLQAKAAGIAAAVTRDRAELHRKDR